MSEDVKLLGPAALDGMWRAANRVEAQGYCETCGLTLAPPKAQLRRQLRRAVRAAMDYRAVLARVAECQDPREAKSIASKALADT